MSHFETRSVVVAREGREGERLYLPTARRVPCDCWIGEDHLQATEAEHREMRRG